MPPIGLRLLRLRMCSQDLAGGLQTCSIRVAPAGILPVRLGGPVRGGPLGGPAADPGHGPNLPGLAGVVGPLCHRLAGASAVRFKGAAITPPCRRHCGP